MKYCASAVAYWERNIIAAKLEPPRRMLQALPNSAESGMVKGKGVLEEI